MRGIGARCPVNRKVLISLPGWVTGVRVREWATPNPGPSSPEPKASPSSRPLRPPTPTPRPHPSLHTTPPPPPALSHPQSITVTSTAHGFPPAAQAWQALHGSKRIKRKEKAVAHWAACCQELRVPSAHQSIINRRQCQNQQRSFKETALKYSPVLNYRCLRYYPPPTPFSLL